MKNFKNLTLLAGMVLAVSSVHAMSNLFAPREKTQTEIIGELGTVIIKNGYRDISEQAKKIGSQVHANLPRKAKQYVSSDAIGTGILCAGAFLMFTIVQSFFKDEPVKHQAAKKTPSAFNFLSTDFFNGGIPVSPALRVKPALTVNPAAFTQPVSRPQADDKKMKCKYIFGSPYQLNCNGTDSCSLAFCVCGG